MKGLVVVLLLAALPLTLGGCSSKLDRGVAWCNENYSGYVRDDCLRQMRRNLDGT